MFSVGMPRELLKRPWRLTRISRKASASKSVPRKARRPSTWRRATRARSGSTKHCLQTRAFDSSPRRRWWTRMSPRERLTVCRFSGHVQAERVMPSEAPRFKPFRHLSYISELYRLQPPLINQARPPANRAGFGLLADHCGEPASLVPTQCHRHCRCEPKPLFVCIKLQTTFGSYQYREGCSVDSRMLRQNLQAGPRHRAMWKSRGPRWSSGFLGWLPVRIEELQGVVDGGEFGRHSLKPRNKLPALVCEIVALFLQYPR